MDSGDIFFFAVVAVSVGGSILKAIRKKGVAEQETATGKSGGDIFRKFLQEIEQADDYIPKSQENPAPAPLITKKIKEEPEMAAFRKNVEAAYLMPENSEGEDASWINASKPIVAENALEDPEPDCDFSLSDPETLKKAVVYSEILKTKF